MSYTTLKMFHLLGVVLFLGNIVVTAVWKTMANRSGNLAVIHFSQKLVNLTDFLFTATGAALVAVTGLMMVPSLEFLVQQRWILGSLIAFGASAVIWVAVLIPVQVRQTKVLRQSLAAGELDPSYQKLSRWWAVAGTIATLLPLIPMWLMTHKG